MFYSSKKHLCTNAVQARLEPLLSTSGRGGGGVREVQTDEWSEAILEQTRGNMSGVKSRCRPSKGRRCVVLKSEVSLVQKCRNINVHVDI